MENNRLGCINRDLNACLNIRKIFKYYLKNNKRPLKYERSFKLKRATNQYSQKDNKKSSKNVRRMVAGSKRVQLLPKKKEKQKMNQKKV